MTSTDRFGYEWDKYSEMDPNYELQFKRWVTPLKQEDFQGRKVLDAGCGMGRNSFWALRWGAREVVAFDYDKRTVAAAQQNLKTFSNAEVLYKSIYEITWENEFDIAFSIGVIHHLEDPKRALSNLIRAVKPGGRVLIWVYSYEGNEWIVKLVDPIRKNITSKVPIRLVHFLSYLASVPLWLFVKIFHGPSAYLKQLAGFGFRHIHSIVFDQLIPEIANYWKKDEVENLFNEFSVDVEIFRPENNMGWTAVAVKKGEQR